MSKLATINGLSYLNTSETVNMNSMFKGCKLLKTLDLTNFNTENVENMGWMFHGCEALTTIYVGGRWNTSKVTNSYQMFQGCTNLVGGNGTTYNASHVDVTYARFDTETTPGYLTMRPYVVFADGELTFYCDGKNGQRDGTEYGLNSAMSLPQWVGVKESVVTAKFDTSFANARPTSTANWFYAMPNLTDIRGLKYLNTSKVVYMKSMFYMLHMTTLDLSEFNTSSVKNMESMFSQCFNLRTIVVGDGWTTAGVTSSAKMFEACYNLVGGAGTSYTADYINADYAHVDGGPGNPGYLTSLEQFSNYDLWIAGIRVTKNNKDNLGELVAELSEEAMERYFEGEMDVTFDGNTLTLQNAIINSTGDDGIRSKISDLKINVCGQNTITTNNNIGINIENNSGDGSVTFLGNGSLDIKSQRAAGLRSNIDVVLKGGVKMTAESKQGMGIRGWKSTAAAAYPSLTMYGYETMLNAKGSGTGSLRGFHALNLNDGLKIIQPEGATFKAYDGVLTASGNIQYDWVIIATQDFYDGMAPHMGSTIKSGNTYNLAGQKVGADYKGIVVRDGKKMLVK